MGMGLGRLKSLSRDALGTNPAARSAAVQLGSQISGGTLALSGAGSIASSSNVIDNGTFSIAAASGPVSITSLSGVGAVTLDGTDLIITNGSGTFNGSITGSGGIRLAGGKETLSGSTALRHVWTALRWQGFS